MIYLQSLSEHRKNYENYLKIIGSLSSLFSDSNTPYLYYRIAEKIYCMAFGANDLSRSDSAIDASLNEFGIGLKTFLRNNDKTFQKIAEFNKDKSLYDTLEPQKAIYEIAKLRNNRIEFARNQSATEKMIYHCVVRDVNKFFIFEELMQEIDIDSLKFNKKSNNSISFYDKHNEYNFNISKSTLLKRFETKDFLYEIDIQIIENPLEALSNLLENQIKQSVFIQDTIYLPLYGKNREVFTKSGLNQWNAGGRKRDYDEIYIPIPAEIHKYKPNFFPPRYTSFNLKIPSQQILSCKLCQDNSKALMSDPNKAFGQWLLRDVLKLKQGELLTIEMLEEYGIDSVRIDKIDSENYEINFATINSYDDFIEILKESK
jgi:hypothetical protein